MKVCDPRLIFGQAIAAKRKTHNHLEVDPETELLVISGATGALYASLLALLNPGDEVIVFEPFYGYPVSTLISLRLKPVIVPLFARTGSRPRCSARRNHAADSRDDRQHAIDRACDLLRSL